VELSIRRKWLTYKWDKTEWLAKCTMTLAILPAFLL
jgi:hypothetical protein